METNTKKRCRRCQSVEPYIILDKVHLECRSCFLESCNKKIRSTIGKSKLVRNNDPILISYSGGPSSSALLDLIKNSIGSDTRREQKFRPSILHIDMQSVLESQRGVHEFVLDRQHNLRLLLEQLAGKYPSWPIYWTTIEMCMVSDKSNKLLFTKFSGTCDTNNPLLLDGEAHMLFHDSLSHSGDLTDQQQFIADKCANFIPRLAREINESIEKIEDRLKYVFTASTSTQLANNLLVDVILGRGATIRSTVSICDQSHPVPLMRPMRDFSKKEIAYYLKARALESFIQPNLLTMAKAGSSIQAATESFLTKLYVDYPSTYSTLLKTGNKMHD